MKYSLLGACAVAICCTAPAFAQGLTRVQTIGLQQQLRDDGCGVTHVSGRLDAATRAAVRKCQSKYSGATDAKTMLAAMNIGFGNGIPDPSLSMARSGAGGSMSAGGISGSPTTTDSTSGKVDLNKATPMKPPQGSMNPVPLPTHDTTTTPVDTSNVTPPVTIPTAPPVDTIPKRDTIPSRDTMPTMPTMPKRDTMPTMPKRDTMPKMPKRDTMPQFTSPRI